MNMDTDTDCKLHPSIHSFIPEKGFRNQHKPLFEVALKNLDIRDIREALEFLIVKWF